MRIVNLFLSMSILFMLGCKRERTATSELASKPVKVEMISSHQQDQKFVFNGTIKEKKLTTLSFRVGGPLVRLNVEVGDYVTEGQVIAAIDKRDYEIQLQSAKVQLNQLSDEYKRYQTLFENDKIPANSYEKVESGYLMAKTAYENAMNQLNDTELKAPFSGYVHEKMTENFQTVGPGQPIVSLIDVSTLEVVIAVPENQINYVRENPGKNFLQVKNAQVSDLPLRFESIGKKALEDGLYEVKLSFDNKKGLEIYPGMTAEVTMVYENNTVPIEIPSSSVFHDGDNNCVWKYDASTQKVEKSTVQISSFGSGGKIIVTSGIRAGDIIVTGGVHELTEGQSVEPIKAPSKTNIGGLL